MKFLRFASVLALAVTMSGAAAQAVTLAQAAKPAEVPPASYKGDVYVDSRGCAYVRATIGTAVNWVPRLSRDRQSVICGLTPTAKVAGLASSRPPAPPTPPAPPAMTPVVAAAPAATARQAAPSPAAAPATSAVSRTMTVTCPTGGAPARVRIGGDTVAIQCSPTQTAPKSYIVRHANGERTRVIANPPAAPVVQTPVLAATTTARSVGAGDVIAGGRVVIGGTAAPTRTAGTAPTREAAGGYTFGRGYGVTTYPGVVDPVPTPGAPGQARAAAPNALGPLPGSGAGNGYASGYNLAPVQAAPRVVIPEGYRAAWSDGRLNPLRGPRTLYGDQQMAQTLTIDQVPMRSLDPAPAQGLILQTKPTLATLFSSKGPTAVTPTTVARSAPVIATSASAAAPSKRYVQVGMFNVATNAAAAAAKLQGLGLPGRVAQTASGKTVVIAGPYGSVPAVNAALATARRGFPDAFLRN